MLAHVLHSSVDPPTAETRLKHELSLSTVKPKVFKQSVLAKQMFAPESGKIRVFVEKLESYPRLKLAPV